MKRPFETLRVVHVNGDNLCAKLFQLLCLVRADVSRKSPYGKATFWVVQDGPDQAATHTFDEIYQTRQVYRCGWLSDSRFRQFGQQNG